MQRVLIANRGDVAVRVSRTLTELGFAPVGVHAAGEAAAAYLRGMAARVALPGAGQAAFLDAAALAAAARGAACAFLHPGWGFLSEAPALAEASAAAGVVFVGPSPATLRLCGDKVQARALAVQCGVAVAPAAATLEEAAALLAQGLVMIKAASGGGGRGMRVVRAAAELASRWQEASAEAASSFGDGTVFAEALLENARHVEVQVAGDGAAWVSLGTRDCSVQRRHQKLVEWAPAAVACGPALEDAALRMAAALGYRGLGTWEFLVRGADFHFLEINPRLQVEHTVTEAVTGLDLVAVQMALAAGESLAASGLAPPPSARGVAVQLRLNAETVLRDGGVRPSGGVIAALALPGGPGVRVDMALRAGDAVESGYDSLLAKIVVQGPDRASVLRRAARALGEFRAEGVATTAPLLRRLLARPELAADAVDTGLLDRLLGEIGEAASAPLNAAADVVAAPMAGRLAAVLVTAGERVRAGQDVALIEAMKMQMALQAGVAGIVRAVCAVPGETLAEGAPVLLLEPGEPGPEGGAVAVSDLDRVRDDLARLQARIAAVQDEGRPEAVARRHAAGKRMARANLAALFDDGFSEYGAMAVAAQRRRRPMAELLRVSPADGLICGVGEIGGRPAAAMAYDYTVMAGTQGFLNHKKTDRLLGVVAANNLPLVLFAEGGGGRPGDTDVMGVAGLDLTTFGAFAARSGKAPLLGIVSGHCFAGNAALLGCCDTVIATPDASIGMGGPAMIEGGGLGVFRPEHVGPVSVQEPNGVIDLVVADEAEAVAAARRYLGYFSPAPVAFAAPDARLLRHAVPEDRKRIYDMRALVAGLADTGSVLELRRGFGAGMITALIRVEGAPYGLIANNPMHLGGAIDADAADKAARFLQLCDAHGLPVISLCDTPGFMVGPQIEKRAQVRHVCRLFVLGAALRVPVFCIVPRKGYGLGAMAMAAGGFHQPRFTVAWPSGEFGGMGLEGAVRLGYRRELAEAADPEALFAQLVGKLYEEGQAINMAAYVEIDAVIDPAETRAWITRGRRHAGEVRGSARFIDTW